LGAQTVTTKIAKLQQLALEWQHQDNHPKFFNFLIIFINN
jgi:hypothetical protein